MKAKPLRRFARHPSRYHLKDEGQGKIVGALVDRLADVERLWHGHVESGCEACILAFVGGDEDVLRDLWAMVVGRTHRRRKTAPVFGGLIGAWIDNLHDGKRVKREATALGRAVKRVRWAVSKHRREKRSMHSVSKTKRKAMSGRRRGRDSGYGSATGNGVDLAAWKPADDLGATLVYRSSSSSSREKGRDRCDYDDDPYIQNVIEYDVLLRRRETLSRCQSGNLGPNVSTHIVPRDSTPEEQDGVYNLLLRKKSPAAYQYKQPHASDASMSSSTLLHMPAPSISEKGNDEYDADNDDSDYDDEPGTWYRTIMQNSDAEFDPTSRAASNFATNVGHSESPTSHQSDEATNARRLTLGLVDDFSQSEEPYDPAQWTDVTLATRETRWKGEGVAEGCGSSSVYSTNGTALPHPPVPTTTSTVLSSGGRLRRALASRDDLAWAAWPNPFTDDPPITTITHSNDSQSLLRASPSSSARIVAGTIDDSIITTAVLSPDDLYDALEGFDDLFIANTEKGNTAGIPEGTVLPWESISAVGRCSCTAQLEMWREGIPCDQ